MQGENLRKGTWVQEEDEQLTSFVTRLGERQWDSLAKVAGLKRSGKSCRLRWLNYLRPNLKHGPFSVQEDQLIIQLQHQWGNKWSKIARRLPGRTDNEIKNYWRTYLRKRVQVQPEGELNCEVENVTEDSNKKSNDVVNNNVNNNNYFQESEGETSKDSSVSIENFPSSNWGMENSLYETRILNWITELQNEYGGDHENENEKEREQDCNNTMGTFNFNPQDFAEGFDTWDYSGFLWNL